MHRGRRDVEAGGAGGDVLQLRPRLAARPAPASGAPRRRRSPRARAPGRRPRSGRPDDSTTARRSGARPSRQWQTQWPISWAIVKRKRRSGGSLRPPARSSAFRTMRRSAGRSIPEQSMSQRSSTRRPSRSSAIASTGTGSPSPPKRARYRSRTACARGSSYVVATGTRILSAQALPVKSLSISSGPSSAGPPARSAHVESVASIGVGVAQVR